jgi:hypothetical protein
MFSTLKYVVAPNFEKFRQHWQAKYLGGFVVHSKAFDGIKGDFPIGFLLWDTSKPTPISRIETQVLSKDGQALGEKSFYNLASNTFLNAWIEKPETNEQLALPLSNAVTVSTNPRLKKSCDDMLGYLYASNNDLQHAGQETLITSSIYTGGNGGGSYLKPKNLWQAAVVFTVRMLIAHTWLNHNDQFLQPSQPLSDAFKTDCLIWMLFNGKNLSAGADGLEWQDKKWSLVNHFIPFTEAEVGAAGRFESNFMSGYLAERKLSPEAKAVLDAGRVLWRSYHATQFEKKIRDEFKLGRPDVGWYQIRKALEANSGNDAVDFAPFKAAYEALSTKLRPLVFELGFLR